MLLAEATKTETNCNLPSKSFSIKASPIAFDILSSKLYSDPILAIVRELLTNAYDSHKAANTLDKPIHVNIPNQLERNFIIRDYGTGLSKEEVLTLYTTFFDSTKSTSNDFTGCFGLGSKTPFAYTSSFTVISYYNNIKYQFIVVKKDGYPQILSVSDTPTLEPNGLEISIPVQVGDFWRFAEAIANYLKRMPEIIVDADISREKPEFTVDNVNYYPYRNRIMYGLYKDNPNITIKQGQNIYDLKDIAYSQNNLSYLEYLAGEYSIEIEVPIGTLGITPSREHLSADEANVDKISKIIEDANKKLAYYVTDKWVNENSLTPNMLAVKNRYVSDKYFKYANIASISLESDSSNKSSELRINLTYLKVRKVTSFTIAKNSCGIKDNTHNLAVLVPYECKYHRIKKIQNIINNYSDFEYDNVYIFQLPHTVNCTEKTVYGTYSIYYGPDISSLKFIRELHGIIWTVNNIPECNFDVTLLTINQLLRKYPNNRSKRKFIAHNTPNDDSRYVRVKSLEVYINAKDKIYKSSLRNVSSTHSEVQLKELLESNSPSNTVFIENSSFANMKFLYDYTLWSYTITVFINVIAKNETTPMLLQYLKEKAAESGVCFDADSNFNVIMIGKSHKRHLKNYLYVTLEDIADYIKSKDFCLVTNDLDRDTVAVIRHIDEIFTKSFPKLIYERIRKTYLYRKISVFNKLIERYKYLDANLHIFRGSKSLLQCLLISLTGTDSYLKELDFNSKIMKQLDKVGKLISDFSSSRYDRNKLSKRTRLKLLMQFFKKGV